MNPGKGRDRPSWRAGRVVHDRKRKDPARHEAQLRQAAKRAGLPIIGYEYEIWDATNQRYMWFDVAVRVAESLALIDINAWGRGRGTPKRDKRVLDYKTEYCKRKRIPYLITTAGGVMEMEAEIEMWALRVRFAARRRNQDG